MNLFASQTLTLKRFALAPLVGLGLTAAGCATMTSTPETTGPTGTPISTRAGLPYYLPRRPIILSVVVADDGKSFDVKVAAGVAEPDFGHRYTLKYGQNYLGTNALTVVTSENGLLQSSDTSIKSGVGQFATDLGGLAGALSAGGAAAAHFLPPAPLPAPCVPGRTYNYALYPELGDPKEPLSCDISVHIERAAPQGALTNSTNLTLQAGAGTPRAGVYFRQALPYSVEVRDKGGALLHRYQAYSPDQSDTFYFPLVKTFFSDSKANVTLVDGVLTKVDESADGEINGAVQVPANFIAGYAKALGSVFEVFSTATTDKQKALLNNANLQYCASVVRANTPMNAPGRDQVAAEAAIKAACG